MKEPNESKIRKMIQGINQISTLPMIYARINELIDNPTSSASNVGKIISGDQGLTVRLLKLVNSAFYGFPSKIDTVSRAVTIIGFKQLRELVCATSVLGMFKDLGNDVSLNMEDFWKHSIACGLTSRILAIYGRQENPESFFVAGLLHDIGRLILLEKYSEKYKTVFSVANEKNLLVFEAEMDIFGFTHAAVAKELVSFWNLPHNLQGAVGYHHEPGRVEDNSTYADIVHIADILVHANEIGSSGERFIPPLVPDAWKKVGLKKSILEPAFENLHEQFQDTYSFIMGSMER